MREKVGELVVRYLIFFIGIILLAFGIVLSIKAELGVSPWDVLHIGLYKQLGLTIGSWSIIVGIFILTTSAILVKSWPKFGSYLNLILVGVFIDIFMLLPITSQHFIMNLFLLFSGIIFMAVGMGIYISAQLGAGPRDSLMIAIQLKTSWKVQNVRLMMEVLVLIVGYLLGGPVHIGTIITSLFLGHIYGWVAPHCQKITDNLVKRTNKQVIENRNIAT